MSRIISEKKSVTLSPEENVLRSTEDGKLLYTSCEGQSCALLIKGGRLTAVSALDCVAGNLGAVYLGKVQNVLPNMNACFVKLDEKEVCFLPLKELSLPFLRNRHYDGRILAGDELLVAVKREAQKTKQASVTTRISFSNDYLTLELGSDRVSYSSRLDSQQRKVVSALLQEAGICCDSDNGVQLTSYAISRVIQEAIGFPVSLGLIVRTKAGECRSAEELASQYASLAEKMGQLLRRGAHCSCFTCLQEAPTPYERVFDRLVYSDEFSEIVTDDKALYPLLSEYAKEHFPQKNVRLYSDSILTLSSLYSLRTKLKEALDERVWLKTGGYLVIQPTEALTVIDVNSGKYERKRNTEEAALEVNLEAAAEIALQLRLRNLSGIIIADFINLKQEASRKKLLRALNDAVRKDKLQTTVIDMTPLGLVEITRKKENKPLYEQFRHRKRES